MDEFEVHKLIASAGLKPEPYEASDMRKVATLGKKNDLTIVPFTNGVLIRTGSSSSITVAISSEKEDPALPTRVSAPLR